jgi:hypothetical protein
MFNLHTQKFEVLEYKLNVKKLQNKGYRKPLKTTPYV